MNDTTIILPVADAPIINTPAKRGRKPGETPAQKLERLQRAVAEAKIAAREAEYRKYAVVGEVLLAEAESDGQLLARIRDVLRSRVTGQQARADIATLLAK